MVQRLRIRLPGRKVRSFGLAAAIRVSRNGCEQVHPGAVEAEAVRRDALPPRGALLA